MRTHIDVDAVGRAGAGHRIFSAFRLYSVQRIAAAEFRRLIWR
jgi:hypothetical protein